MERKTFRIIDHNNETIKLGGIIYQMGYNTTKPCKLEEFSINKWKNGMLYYYMDDVDEDFYIEEDMYCLCDIDRFKYEMNISEMRKDVYIY